MRIKIVLIVLLFVSILAKNKTEITADRFEMDNKAHITKFIGSVRVAQQDDRIYSDLIDVYTDKKNRPKKYVAINNVRFKIKNSTDFYRGTCGKLIYTPATQEYILLGNARVDQNNDSKILMGEKIIIHRGTGKAKVFGDKKPVKFIFDNED
jgi:lipopolysaccharide transport protein LptA